MFLLHTVAILGAGATFFTKTTAVILISTLAIGTVAVNLIRHFTFVILTLPYKKNVHILKTRLYDGDVSLDGNILNPMN